ncbi:Rieske (2Fe-2S) protein [Modestobacter roseus]|uniref:Cytochrome bc1 complex Rieske iron-sulfur subunit n=1 Tax=Modestobacter roseus TaxID=1181884 RepID=A0A562IYH3_9ACTN|nr:Rieske (2Fe-2S) protein [Modestobacter roseus]TWH75634.1 nitrite reductase/ring-hydroxylating ferredoxin subunit [Modestobacter roseus]
MHSCFSRRALFVAGGAGLGAAALTACAGPGVPEVAGAAAGSRLVALGEVPVGGSYELSVDGQRVVLSRPADDVVVAFDAACTHQGCAVRPAEGDRLACPCHGSEFDPFTGEALAGPATEPLAPVAVRVSGEDVVLG